MWDDRLRALLEFRDTHGHIDVPRRWADDPALSHWVINQRRLLRLGKLPARRLEQLNSLGIRWRSAEERTRDCDRRWNRMCDALHAYLHDHGHCDVPDGWPGNPELARWVVRQRHLMRSGLLREDRLGRFEERGIDWSLARGRSRARDGAWERLFRALAQFRAANGDCAVPKNWTGNPKLARWVARQRQQMRHGALRQDRQQRLEELGLQLRDLPHARPPQIRRRPSAGARDRNWRRRYESLAGFRAVRGHSDVPRRFEDDPGLARWVSRQRERRRLGLLPADQVALLDDLQFRWSAKAPAFAG